ncbi:MAG: DNA recombination protein RmuC, partial [Parvularculaceae bacterium]|nr:DNA recombination protein RmuC [Parvularculaceae bacterium]
MARERESRRAEAQADDLRRDLAEELDRKLSALAARLPEKPVQAAQFAEAPEALMRAIERIARDLAGQRAALDDAVARLSQRIEDVGASSGARDSDGLRQEMAGLKRALSERFTGPTAPQIQLGDILRNVLPPEAYELKAALSNNRKVDCLVRLPNPPGPVAIDAHFPVEAFQKLHTDEARDQISAENEFRRAALRHIVDVAERFIIPGETADSAVVFLPTESMHAELHARFQDVVQDSYRARVWVVSPTSLMATLHTMRAVLSGSATLAAAPAPVAAPAVDAAVVEVDQLRQRLAALEAAFERVRLDVRDARSRPTEPNAFAATAVPTPAAAPPPATVAPIAPEPVSSRAAYAHPQAEQGADSSTAATAARAPIRASWVQSSASEIFSAST